MSQAQPPQARSSYTRRPGDRVIRRSVLKPESVSLAPPRPRRRGRHPALVLVYGFAGVILLGALLLMLPIASADGQAPRFVDALFTATTATCVTGLVVVDTGTHWSLFGHIVILALIQVGGLGFMTSSTLIFLLLGRRTTLWNRVVLGHSLGAETTGGVVRLVRHIAVMTLAIEGVGAVLLALRFARDMPLGQALWWGLFHSVSAFNNAGIDLMGDYRSLIGYRQDGWVLLTIGALIVVGGLGYTVLANAASCRAWRRLTLDTKLVLTTTAALLVAGTLGIAILEWSNPAGLAGLPWQDKVLNALFHSISPRTAGFTTLDLGHVREETLFFTIALMFIGGASASTAGGIKVQTFSVLMFAIVSAIRGTGEHVVAFGREIPHPQVYRALAVALLAIAAVFGVALLLTVTETARFIDLLFETVSAFGTVGLSTGVTPGLTAWGRVMLIGMMFMGRLGPLTLALALAARAARRHGHGFRYAPETVRIG